MARRRRFLRSFLYLAAITVLFFVTVAVYTYLTEGGLALLAGNAVAVVNIDGVIEESEDTVETLDRIARSDSIRAVVLRVDSPGGGVAPSQEIYDAVLRVREKKPVVASLGAVAASGGYYIAAASDVIVANAGTLTGSIGVVMELANFRQLLDKIGLAAVVLKAGKYKDIGSPVRPMTDEERALLEGLLTNIHEQFIGAVSRGRKLPADDVRKVADGRIYSGEQALELGLVDQLGGLRDAVRLAGERAGIEGDPTTVPFRQDRAPWWWRRVFSLLEAGSGSPGGLRFLYTGPAA
ncbi:MAG: signal peptide peptidase SppA [Candidatus Binatia bacterium]